MKVEKFFNKAILSGPKFEIFPQLLHRFFETRVEEKGEAVALIFDDLNATKQLSFGALSVRSNRMANQIIKIVKENNLEANKDGDWIVAICMRPSIDLITTMLAIWKAGAGYLPIDVDFPGIRIQHILSESKPLIVFYDDDFKSPEIFHDLKAFNFKEFTKLSVNNGELNIPDEATLTKGIRNMALFVYTSGSTGSPKGVRLQHVTAQLRLEWQWTEFPFADSETFCLFKSSITFLDHFCEIWNPLLGGRTLIVVPKEFTPNPEKLVPILEKYRIERITTVPTLVRGIILYVSMLGGSSRLPHLKLWISSGEELTHALSEEFFECFSDGHRVLSTFYGATEVMADVLTFKMTSKKDLQKFNKIPIGRPIFNTQVYILDEFNNPVMEGEIGNIFISGDLVSDGYINSPGVPGAEVFSKNHLSSDSSFGQLYRMGDIGTVKDGLVYYHGRTDTQIKVHGHRVEMNEVENIIDKLNFLEKSVARVYNRGLVDQKFLAFMKLKVAYAAMTAADIKNELFKMMPKYMVPDIVLIDQLPFLASGKVDVNQLMTLYENQVNGQDDEHLFDFTDIPAGSVEKARTVFKIIAESIGKSCQTLSKQSHFYSIGGDSLNTILCVCKLRAAKYEISIQDLLTASSVGEIISKLVEVEGDNIQRLAFPEDPPFFSQPLSKAAMNECVGIIAKAFVEKDVIAHLVDGLNIEHFSDYYFQNWDFFVDKKLSFMVRDSSNRIVGVSLNYEVGDEPFFVSRYESYRSFANFFDFIEKDVHTISLISGFKVLEAFDMATSEVLTSAENVHLCGFMEENILKIGRSRNFHAVMTTNTSQLTTQIDGMVLDYQKLKEFQVNRYVDENKRRLFEKAADSVKCVTMWKNLN